MFSVPPPNTVTSRINAVIRMTEQTFSEKLADKTSEDYLDLAGRVLASVSPLHHNGSTNLCSDSDIFGSLHAFLHLFQCNEFLTRKYDAKSKGCTDVTFR